MGNPSRFLIGLACTAIFVAGRVGFAAPPEPLPTQEQLHEMFDAGQYQPLLTKLARVLPLKGEAGKPYDMIDLNLLKAETCLQQNLQDMASVAANEAAKLGSSSPDNKLGTEAHALAALLKRSQKLQYTPKSPAGSKPMSILDRANRQAVYVALLADMQGDVDAKLKAAKTSKSLPPISTAIQSLGDMSVVETMATGSNAQSQKAGDELSSTAHTLMKQTVAALDKRVDAIQKSADKMRDLGPSGRVHRFTGVAEKSYRKTGLGDAERNELRDAIDACAKIAGTCTDLQAVMKKDARDFKDVVSAAEATAKQADQVLNADYNKVTSK